MLSKHVEYATCTVQYCMTCILPCQIDLRLAASSVSGGEVDTALRGSLVKVVHALESKCARNVTEVLNNIIFPYPLYSSLR